MKSNKLSIYLIKEEHQALEDAVDTSNGVIEIPEVGNFVFRDSHPYRPNWVDSFFGATLTGDPRLISSSAQGVLIVSVERGGSRRTFAVCFGQGRHLLKEGVVEDRFGLKVVLNSIDPQNWRSIEKTSLGSVPKHSREQMSRDVVASDFGIDIEQDLVSNITAKSRIEGFGKMISGKDALSLTSKVDTTNIKEFLERCLERYESDEYKADFGWIDQIKELKRSDEVHLNTLLVRKLQAGDSEKLWMAVPEVVDWADTEGFRYRRPARGETFSDLSVAEFLRSLGDRPIDLDVLKFSSIYRVSSSTGDIVDKWSAYRCLYAELALDGKVFLLHNGRWYEIAQSFTQEVEDHFRNMARSEIVMPDCAVNDEGAYNLSVPSSIAGAACLDRQNISHGGGHNKIEFCDIITSDMRIIHVKRYGASSLLSHLFQQGVVSGELFASEGSFRKKLNDILPDPLKLTDPQGPIVPQEYEVVFAIISGSRHDLDIPFFSKVGLKNAQRRLAGYGYKVTLKKIQKVEAASQESASEAASG